ncbi:hypothetical protein B0H16DRAFT_587094 [Mycena metata]|uniref:Transmembrane protein n=1 Tax=Mycena metata TaxID=1033252 RepID=A0AAD7JAY8_9AGAR|nr:hypothetical protein B0H16DRAFT_587094 [Mycena metata]
MWAREMSSGPRESWMSRGVAYISPRAKCGRGGSRKAYSVNILAIYAFRCVGLFLHFTLLSCHCATSRALLPSFPFRRWLVFFLWFLFFCFRMFTFDRQFLRGLTGAASPAPQFFGFRVNPPRQGRFVPFVIITHTHTSRSR